MTTFIIIIVLAALMALLWNRVLPIDHDRWHADPADEEDLGFAGVRFIGRDAPRYPEDPDTVLTTIQDIALSEPGTRLLEGDIDEGMLTFVTRSKVCGLVDFTTVKAVNEGAVTKLSIASRSRTRLPGLEGANAERVDRWLHDMRLRLGQE